VFLDFFPSGFKLILGLYLLRAFQLFFAVFNDGFAVVLFLYVLQSFILPDFWLFLHSFAPIV